MEKIKENVIKINKIKNSGIESQATYHTNYIKINKVIIRGNLEINILALIRNREDNSKTSIFLEVYNLEIKNDCEKNFIQFSCEYNDLENYSFNDELLKSIIQTLNNKRIQTINNNNIFINN